MPPESIKSDPSEKGLGLHTFQKPSPHPNFIGLFHPTPLEIFSKPLPVAKVRLDLRGGGAVRVAGAGVNTATPLFTHKATAANTSGSETRIGHPHCDNKPGAILIVTYNFNPAGLAGTRNDHPVGIYYTGSRWAIYNLDGTAMPVGAAYNVMIANP